VTIDWLAFVTVVAAALVAACVLVTLFAVALRVGDSAVPLRRAASFVLYLGCVAVVLYGIYLIVPIFH
jgi:cytochrome c oxidase assembly factor CtaG